jgi:hypothetical protein
MPEQTSIPVPTALVELIHANNELLKIYQRELSSKVVTANAEMMSILGLNPDDGWRLDMDAMAYRKVEENAPPVGE